MILIPSYISVVYKGQGGHQRHSNGAAGVTVAHQGPYGGEEDSPQERHGTATARDNQWGGPKRRPRERWHGKEVYQDRHTW